METLTKQLIPQLSLHEGRKRFRYFDTTGHATVGVGFNLDRGDARKVFRAAGVKDYWLVRSGEKALTDHEIDALLSYTIKECILEAEQSDVNWDGLSPNRKCVIADMVFNLGPAGFRSFVNTRRLVRDGDYAGASRNMLYSKWAKQVGKRALRLSYMLRNDVPVVDAVVELG
jgi:GH24 family phage-related lysozyme (muramidase)